MPLPHSRPGPAPDAPLILGIGGTMRYGSGTARALTIALDEARRLGARTSSVVGQQLDLPALDFGADHGTSVTRLLGAVREADGIVLASPSYHGGISGLLKNALDHLELTSEEARPYLRDRPVGLIATGDGWQGPNATLASLRQTVHALQGWPTPLGVAHNVAEGGVEPARGQLERMAGQVVRLATLLRGEAPAGPPA